MDSNVKEIRMKIILLSGGSGTRLWPLSNEARSKQFLKILKNEKGDHQSMVQRVYGQLRKASHEDILVATNVNQTDSIRTQIGQDIGIVIEPERRNTWPAIALAAAHLYFKEKCSRDDVVVVLPIDPYAEDRYFELLNHLEAVIDNSFADIALMGVKPTFPTAKYGYIIPNSDHEIQMAVQHETGSAHAVQYFKEKPSVEEAADLINHKGALWNCGVFAFKVGYLMDKLAENIDFSNYEDVLARYSELKKISFDYEVVEKAEKVAVVEYDGVWKDLGTWNTLCDHVTETTTGNVVLSGTSKNTHVINELDIPAVVIGVKDAVVVATHDGILVSDKHESSFIKEYLGDKAQRPMVEKRQWGNYYVLEHGEDQDGLQYMTKKLIVKAGKNISYQYHEKRREVWTVVEGSGLFVKNDVIYPAAPGSVFQIDIGDKHAMRSVDDLTMIEVQLGTDLVEEDIIRIEKNWDRILQLCFEKKHPDKKAKDEKEGIDKNEISAK